MDLNSVISLANEAAENMNDFSFMRWNRYAENNKEFKRPDLWTLKTLVPAPAIYYPGDDIVNARMSGCNVNRNSWNLKTSQPGDIRGYKPIAAQPNGFVDMSGSVTVTFADKQDYAIELWIKSTRDLISHPVTRFSYPVELLMSQLELSYYNTVQQKVKVLSLLNCVPQSATVGEEDPAEGDVTPATTGYSIVWAFPWHKENYYNVY
jgi:hypothetical protein